MSYHNIFAGLLLITTGAFTACIFAIPFGKIKDWNWESYLLIFSFSAYIFSLGRRLKMIDNNRTLNYYWNNRIIINSKPWLYDFA